MPNSPVSEPVVVKPSSQPTGSNRPPTGPQSKLEQTKYDFKDLRFPPQVGNDAKNIHWIKFTPTIQNKSSYSVKKENKQGREVLSVTDSNRRNTGGQLGSSSDPFGLGTVAGVAAGEAILRGAEGLFERGLSGAIGGAIGGAALGGFVGGIVTSIDLTRKTRRAASSICLYMPDTVVQRYTMDYDPVSMTEALGRAGLISQAGGAITQGAIDAARSGDLNFGQTPGSAAASEIAGILAQKSGVTGQGITQALLYSAGFAQNPQIELLFQKISNRNFVFEFNFSPRDATESATIIEIIRAFKFFGAPEIPTTGNGRYFIPPSEFDIQFMVGSNPNPNLPKFATCVLEGVDVDYAASGQFSAFADGMPTHIRATLAFKEVEILHKELIRNGF